MHCFVPSGTATNLVDHSAFKFFTSVETAVSVALRDLGHFDLSYGTVMNEVQTKFAFGCMGKYLAPLFDLMMHALALPIMKY